MTIEIQLNGKSPGKPGSIILINGEPVTRGILDFDIDVSGEIPSVMLKVWPEVLVIKGEDPRFLSVDPRKPYVRHRVKYALRQWAIMLEDAWHEYARLYRRVKRGYAEIE